MTISAHLSFAINGATLTLARESLNLLTLAGARGRWLQNPPPGAALWALHAVDAEGRRADLTPTAASSCSARPARGGVRLKWTGVSDKATGAGPFDVTVTINPVPGKPGVTAWRIAVKNRSRAWTLWTVTFPILPGLVPAGKGDRDRLFYPHGWGMEHVGVDKMPSLQRRYPRGWDYSMQFFGYTRGGHTFYVGAHDPRLTTKDFQFRVDRPNGRPRPRFALTLYPENMSRAGNDLALDYDIIVGLIPGTWHDAATLYGEWARRQPWVTTPPPSAAREPRVNREIHAWQVLSFVEKPPRQWAAEMERLAAELGVRLGVHFYNWHQVPFDISYPDYFPARPGFKGLAARLKKAGIVTMPYINGRLWDANSKSWKPSRAETAVVRHSAERVNPRWLYQPVEEYGSGAKLSPMCPTTAIWRRKVVELCSRIVKELGCDGVYIDQIGAEKAELCFGPAHGHPLGGGGFWLEGYRKIHAEIRKQVGPKAILTTECNWEGCIADFDALLSWAWFDDHDIPLFPAAYSGVTQNFGTQFNAAEIEKDGGAVFCRKMARLFTWGGQLGWGDLTPLLKKANRPLLEFFRNLCRLREAHAATFASGRMLRPPSVRGASGVACSVWLDPVTGHHVLFAVNPTRRPIRATLTPENGRRISLSLAPLEAHAMRV